MMIGIGIWLHSKSSAKAWQMYMQKQLNMALSAGSFISMFALSFLAVFREGAETILFYAGILPLISMQDFLLGIGMALGSLLVLGILFMKASGKLPLNKVFFVLSWLIYGLAFKMLGVSIHALQITSILSNHIVDGVPTIEAIGLYPSIEVLGCQLAFVFIIIGSVYYERITQKR